MDKGTAKQLRIILIILTIISFVIGIFIGSIFFSQEQYLSNKDKIDFSLIYKIKNKLDEKFVDTRNPEDKKEITDKDHIWGAVEGYVASYGDPYTMFLPPDNSKDLKEDIKGEFVGIGVQIMNINGFLTVVSPLQDTPAFKAGIKPKDIILKVDGKDVVGVSTQKSINLIRGEKGTEVTLTIARQGLPKGKEIKVKRDLIKIPTVKTYLKDGVFVIKLFSFTEDSPEKFLEAIKKFAASKTDKLIIDLRGNPGGHLFAATYIAGIFLPKDSVILTEDYGGKAKNTILKSGLYHISDKTINIFSDDLKLAVLVDGGSASASEILAGSLADHNKALLLGTNTFGKGSVQELMPFDDGTSLKVTIAKWILPNGEWISYKGIAPDVEMKISEKEIEEALKHGSFSDYIDPQLERAIKYVAKIKTKKDFNKKMKELRAKKEERKKTEREEKIKEILKNNK